MRKARAGEPNEPQWIEGVPDHVYHGWTHLLSQSTLKTVRKTHCKAAYDQLLVPWEQTPFQAKGEALHIGVLQPDQFESRVVCAPNHERRSKVDKAAHEAFDLAHAGKIILKQVDYQDVMQSIEDLQNHPLAMSLFEMQGVKKEYVGIFQDEESGMMGKFKLDFCGYWQGKHNVIGDLKTTSCDMTDDAIDREIGKWGYDMQDAYYTMGTTILAPAEWRFLFVFINTKTGDVRIKELDGASKEEGRIKMRRAMGQWSRACKAEAFPGWPHEVTKAGLKPWDRVPDFELDQIMKENEES